MITVQLTKAAGFTATLDLERDEDSGDGVEVFRDGASMGRAHWNRKTQMVETSAMWVAGNPAASDAVTDEVTTLLREARAKAKAAARAAVEKPIVGAPAARFTSEQAKALNERWAANPARIPLPDVGDDDDND